MSKNSIPIDKGELNESKHKTVTVVLIFELCFSYLGHAIVSFFILEQGSSYSLMIYTLLQHYRTNKKCEHVL